jgi:hypothetical protein
MAIDSPRVVTDNKTSPWRRRAAAERVFVALLFAAGFALLFRKWLFSGFDSVFGDDADGELFIAIVEHWHHVFAGRVHWSDPIFFYPERGTLGFTDAVFLYGAAHALLRALGFDTFTSFMLVLAALSAVGFFSFLRLARRHFGIPVPWAAAGAFLFAFGNMNAAGLIHAQIYAAMLLPALCDLALTAYATERRGRGAALGAAGGLLHALVFFTAFQTAWFFTAFLLMFALLHPLVFGPRRTTALLRDLATGKLHVVLAYAAAFAAGLVPFAVLYVPVIFSGRHRELAEVFSNSPDARDILNVTDGNLLWGELLRRLSVTGRPYRTWWEVDFGYTPIAFALLLATIPALVASTWRRSEEPVQRDRWLLVLGIAVLVSWLVQLEYFGVRPWSAIWSVVPGARAIRYTFRSQVVANLFAALVIARGLGGLYELAHERRAGLAAVCLLAALIIVEQTNLERPVAISRRKVAAWIEAVPAPPPGCRIFYIAPRAMPADRDGWIHQAQAMLFAEIRNIPTINGYSSWLPAGWDLEEPSGRGYAARVREWAEAKGVTEGLCGLDARRRLWTPGLPKSRS